MTTRRCPHCGVDRPLDRFQMQRGRPSGWCSFCRAEKEAERRAARGVTVRVKSHLTESGKLCLACQQVRPLAEFSPAKRGRGGVSAYCKPCFVAKFKPKKEAARERTAAYRERHRPRYLANHRMAQFKRRTSIEVTSDGTVTDEFLQGLYATDTCRYCQQPTHPEARTADHRIPLARGGAHSASNLVMACFACNSSKRDLTEEEFMEKAS